MVDPRLFRDRAFAASASASLLHHFALFAAVFRVPLYFQSAFWAILVVVALTVVPALLLPAGEARRTST
ncbi:hypothetical protein [Microbispora bryophytorum]|uniref:hypothetical protein n=1 Tax=Microbispora bryophytorum TaxID=1460882 RepID=UPI0033EA5C6E